MKTNPIKPSSIINKPIPLKTQKDDRYQYLMQLNKQWIESQNNKNNFVRSIN